MPLTGVSEVVLCCSLVVGSMTDGNTRTHEPPASFVFHASSVCAQTCSSPVPFWFVCATSEEHLGFYRRVK